MAPVEVVYQDSIAARNDASDQYRGMDSTEEQLEKLVFGDEAGFHENLKLFGDPNGLSREEYQDLVEQASPQASDEENFEGLDDSQLFFLDSGPSAVDSSIIPKPLSATKPDESDHEPAWVDSDDERLMVSLASNPRLRKLRVAESEDLVNGIEYTKRLRQQYERLHPSPEWANPKAKRKKRRKSNASDSSSDSSDDNMSIDSDGLNVQPLDTLLRTNTALTQRIITTPGTRRKLRPEIIDVHRLKDVGGTQPSSITSLHYHPSHPLILSSGPSGLLSLHHIIPVPTANTTSNPLLTTLHLRHTPLTSTYFQPPSGGKIFLAGRRRYFHIWDLETGRVEKVSKVLGHREEQRSMERFKLSPCGRWMGLVGSVRKGGGVVNVLDARTSQWVCECRVEGNGGVADFEWWGNGEGCVIVGKGGEVVEYNVEERRVVSRWVDEGAVGTTVVTLGGRGSGARDLGGDRWVAVGSSSGVVNVYDRKTWRNREHVPLRPKPTRAFDQLVTPISCLAFSPAGQVLCMSSRWKRDALRLVHLPSCTVYRDWPTSATPLGRVSAVAWSANGEMLATGNEQGKIRLWEIRG